MKVEVSEYAARQLESIWDYLAQQAGVRVADRAIDQIMDAIEGLAQRPRTGQKEPMLAHLGLDHRRLVVGRHKVIYRVLPDRVFVADVFDSRQDPEQMAW